MKVMLIFDFYFYLNLVKEKFSKSSATYFNLEIFIKCRQQILTKFKLDSLILEIFVFF